MGQPHSPAFASAVASMAAETALEHRQREFAETRAVMQKHDADMAAGKLYAVDDTPLYGLGGFWLVNLSDGFQLSFCEAEETEADGAFKAAERWIAEHPAPVEFSEAAE